MDETTINLTIIGMALVTMGPRLAPFLVFGKREIAPDARAWLQFVPVSVLSAILLPEIFHPAGQWDFSPRNLFIWAGIISFVVGIWTRNLFATIFAGIAALATIRIAVE